MILEQKVEVDEFGQLLHLLLGRLLGVLESILDKGGESNLWSLLGEPSRR